MKNGPNQNPEKPDPTKERILDRAESLFARKGFQAVSVREITTTAECNLAAVNYYFSNKENLYLEVFRSRWAPRARRIQQCYKDAVAAHRGPLTPQVLVRALAKGVRGRSSYRRGAKGPSAVGSARIFSAHRSDQAPYCRCAASVFYRNG